MQSLLNTIITFLLVQLAGGIVAMLKLWKDTEGLKQENKQLRKDIDENDRRLDEHNRRIGEHDTHYAVILSRLDSIKASQDRIEMKRGN